MCYILTHIQLCSAATEEDLVKAIELNIENLPKAQVQIQPEADEQLPPMAINIFHAENNAEQLQDPVQACADCVALGNAFKKVIEEDPVGQYQKYFNLASSVCKKLPFEVRFLCRGAIKSQCGLF
jgi:hypothetical protein